MGVCYAHNKKKNENHAYPVLYCDALFGEKTNQIYKKSKLPHLRHLTQQRRNNKPVSHQIKFN